MARMAGLAREGWSWIRPAARYRFIPLQTRQVPGKQAENDIFGVLDLAFARTVNGADCGRFDAVEAVNVGAIAQLVERVVRNDEVGGSNPPGSTLRFRLRVAQPQSSRRRSVSGEARRAKTDGRSPPTSP